MTRQPIAARQLQLDDTVVGEHGEEQFTVTRTPRVDFGFCTFLVRYPDGEEGQITVSADAQMIVERGPAVER